MFTPVGGLGDVLALSNLIYLITLELKSVPESAVEYQDLLSELLALDGAINQVHELRPGLLELKRFDGIRALAATCQIALQEFLVKIKKFNKSLGSWNHRRQRLTRFGRGLQWSLAWKEDVKTLRSKLPHLLLAILFLLESQLIESQASIGDAMSTKLSEQRTLLDDQGITLKLIQAQIKSSNDNLNSISTDFVALQQDVAVVQADTTSVLDFMRRMTSVALERYSQIRQIADLITDLLRLTVNLSTEVMQTLVRLLREFGEFRLQLLRIERCLPMHMKYPMVLFRDALNNVTPFPYDIFRQWEGAKRMVAAIFVHKQGLRRVEMGSWFVTHVGRNTRIDPKFWDKVLQPGDELSMTMIFDDVAAREGFCPYPSCGADNTSAEIETGGRRCPQCSRFSHLLRNPTRGTDESSETREDEAAPREQSLGLQTRQELPVTRKSLNIEGTVLPDAPDAPEPVDIGTGDIEECYFIQVIQTNLATENGQASATKQILEEEQVLTQYEDKELATDYINVFVQELGHKTLCFRLSRTTKIRDIKIIICDRTDIPEDRQHLRFAGKQLQSDITLAAVGIEDDNTIHLTQGPYRSSAANDECVLPADIQAADGTGADKLGSSALDSAVPVKVDSSEDHAASKTSLHTSGIGYHGYKPPWYGDDSSYYSPAYPSNRYNIYVPPGDDVKKRRHVRKATYVQPSKQPTHLQYIFDDPDAEIPSYIYRAKPTKHSRKNVDDSYFYYGQEAIKDEQPKRRTRKSSTSSKPSATSKRTRKGPVSVATLEDAIDHGIPQDTH